jgi:hypothetical protein
VPDVKSFVVLADVIASAHCIFGVSVKIGDVFAGIFLYFYIN